MSMNLWNASTRNDYAETVIAPRQPAPAEAYAELDSMDADEQAEADFRLRRNLWLAYSVAIAGAVGALCLLAFP